jgi:hypothetical protein
MGSNSKNTLIISLFSGKSPLAIFELATFEFGGAKPPRRRHRQPIAQAPPSSALAAAYAPRPHPAAARISRSATTRASAVISAPANRTALNRRRCFGEMAKRTN